MNEEEQEWPDPAPEPEKEPDEEWARRDDEEEPAPNQ